MTGISDEGFDPEAVARRYVRACDAWHEALAEDPDSEQADDLTGVVTVLENRLLRELILDISAAGFESVVVGVAAAPLQAAADALYDGWEAGDPVG